MGKRKITLSNQLSDVDFKLLRIYKAVAENGGITAAEDELNIATSTISNYLSDLEQRLGMRLCQRGRKGFALTEQGEQVYSAIVELLGAVDLFQRRIHSSSEQLIGSLRLGVAEGTSNYPGSQLQTTLSRFTAQAPEVYMDFRMLLAEEVPRAVLDQRLALGISYLIKPTAGLELQALHTEHLFVYCGKDHPLFKRKNQQLSLEEIEQHKFVETPRLRRGNEPKLQSERWYFQAYAPHMEARSLLIQTGKLLSYLPEEYVQVMGLQKVMRPLLPDNLNYANDYYLMFRKGTHLSPVEECFLQCLG